MNQQLPRSIRIIEEVAILPVTNHLRQFRFAAFRAIRKDNKNQELIVVRLPFPMVAGQNLWNQQKEFRDALMHEGCWELISFLGCVQNVAWTSQHQIFTAQA